MRKFRYTTGTKIWLVILQQIFAVLLVVSVVLLSALFDRRMLNTNDILDTSFVNSGYYTDVFQKTAQELIKYVTLKEQFEKDGVYDEDKTVDVMAYASGRIGTLKEPEEDDIEEQTGFRSYYRLGDLLKWRLPAIRKMNPESWRRNTRRYPGRACTSVFRMVLWMRLRRDVSRR